MIERTEAAKQRQIDLGAALSTRKPACRECGNRLIRLRERLNSDIKTHMWLLDAAGHYYLNLV